ncbi:unnamed protein product [Moneuplotes crassus]|uniref:Uncharacterized protein n=1 Tax=Euplotes crassus TaxID=5936 RepID=A0AAD1X8R8_EUPCR|nr:unnamed protein product [Moneuplotes crassus]
MEEIKEEVLDGFEPIDEDHLSLKEEILEFLAQDVNLQGMEEMDGDRRAKMIYLSSFQRCLQAFDKYVAEERRDKIYECNTLCEQSRIEIEQQAGKLKNPRLILDMLELKKIENNIDKLWNELRTKNLYKDFIDYRVYSQFVNRDDDILNKYKAMLKKKDNEVRNCRIKLMKILNKVGHLSKANVKDSDLEEIRRLAGEREKRVPGLYENNTNQASVKSRLGFAIPEPQAQSLRDNNSIIGPSLRRQRKQKEKHQEIIELDSNSGNSPIFETIQKNQNQIQSTGITSNMDRLQVQAKSEGRSFVNASLPRRNNNESKQEIEKAKSKYFTKTENIYNKESNGQVSKEEDLNHTQYYNFPSSKSSGSSSVLTMQTPENPMIHFPKLPDISSPKNNSMSIEPEVHHISSKLNQMPKDGRSQEPIEECKEESKSDIYMDDRSQHFDGNISYPLEGSSVMHDLSNEEDLEFIQNCTRKLPNLQTIGFCISDKIPECLLSFLANYFPDEVQYCKFYCPMSSKYLEFNISKEICLISCKVLKTFEFSCFKITQIGLEWFIYECTITHEIIFSHCLFDIPNPSNLFGWCTSSNIGKLVFDRCQVSLVENPYDSPKLISFEEILKSKTISDAFKNLIVCSQTSQ